MSKNDKLMERTKQLRRLITRAREDAELWGTNQKPLLLKGIVETSVFDFTIYDDAYNKFIAKRQKEMNTATRNAAEQKENDKAKGVTNFAGECLTQTDVELQRIANALERIADALEKESGKDL